MRSLMTRACPLVLHALSPQTACRLGSLSFSDLAHAELSLLPTCLHDQLLVGTQPKVTSSRKPSQTWEGRVCRVCPLSYCTPLHTFPLRGKLLQAGRPHPGAELTLRGRS